MTSIEEIYEKIDFLPPFPMTVTKVLALLRDPDVSAEAISETVKFDQALTTNILKLCNSSYYGLRRTVNNLKDAIVIVGFSEVKKMIIRTGTKQYFEKRKPGYESEQGEMWRHGLAASIIAGKINTLIPGANQDFVFIAALLHDIGKLVLSEFVEDVTTKIFEIVDTENVSFLDAEQRILGIGHADLGADVLERWDFPEEIVSAVRKHHSPHEEEDSTIDDVVRLADSLAMLMGYETSVDGLAYPGYADLWKIHGLDHSHMEKIMAESLEEINKIESEYGVAQED